jgi:hypothetical protein
MAAEQIRAMAGSCHCGNLRLELQWPVSAGEMPARACGCSFCTKHGGVWTSHPAARLVLRIADPAEATRYRFGTGTADCLEGVDLAALDRVSIDFEGEAVADRLARRQARWIAEVAIEAGPD